MSGLVSIKSSYHGRERRLEREISKEDAALARRYGILEGAGGGLRKYTFRGSVFVTTGNQEVTCYHSNDYASPFSGTRCTLPRLIPLHHEFTSRQQLDAHRALQRALLAETDNSRLHHTIVILSLSSLMRQDDVDGARCRSDAVWAAVAEGLVHHSISTDRPQMTDHVVSVLGLIDGTEKVILDHEPLDFVLYNKMISLRHDWGSFRPQGRAVLKRSIVEFIELHSRRRRGATISSRSVTVLLIASDDLSLPEGSVLDQKAADYLQSRCGSTRFFCFGLVHESLNK